MARWNIRAQVIDTGVIEMGTHFVTYNGVKVVTPDGRRSFLGRVTMHNEINALFRETEGEFVDLHFVGPKGNNVPLLYGLKTDREDAHSRFSPMYAAKAQVYGALILSLPLCFLLIGFGMIPVFLLCLVYLARWNPPSRTVFEALPDQGTSSLAPARDASSRRNSQAPRHDVRQWTADAEDGCPRRAMTRPSAAIIAAVGPPSVFGRLERLLHESTRADL